jgi:hypothetical protein
MTYQVDSEVEERCIAVMAPPEVDWIVPTSDEFKVSGF